MSGYITAIAAISVVSTVMDMVMSNGNIKKYVRYILSLALVLAIVSPIMPFIKKIPDAVGGIGDFFDGYTEVEPEIFNEMAEHSSSALENALESAVGEKYGISVELEIFLERTEKNSAKINSAELTMSRSDLIYFDAVIDYIEKTLNCEVKLIERE